MKRFISSLRLFSRLAVAYFAIMASNPLYPAHGGLARPVPTPLPLNPVAEALLQKARSQSPEDLAGVRQALTSKATLLRLNTAPEYAGQLPANLAVAPFLEALSRHPAGHTVLAALCTDSVFTEEQARNECLLAILPQIHPLPAAALPFLRKNVLPESDSLEVAIRTLFDIDEPASLAIFAEEASNDKQDEVLIVGWFRDPLLRHRRSPAVLAMCLDLLTGKKLSANLKNALVEALFDYRPAAWYQQEGPAPEPPAEKTTSHAASVYLHKICELLQTDPAISEHNKTLASRQ